MSFAISAALQSAVYGAMAADSALTALVGDQIFDAVPTGAVPELYVSLGDERVRDASDQTRSGAIHRLDIFVRTTQPGFIKAKAVGAAISDVLHDASLPLPRGRLVFLRFERADARRTNGNATREILLRFRARVDDE